MREFTTTDIKVRGHKLRHSDKYAGNYKGVAFEIARHNGGGTDDPHPCWCFYLFIHEDSVPAEHADKIFLPLVTEKYGPQYNYMGDGLILNKLDGWNGGITYYDVEQWRGKRCVRVGCDYDHLWDHENRWPYDVSRLLYDTHKTIDSLIETCPWLLMRCNWNGKYYPREQMLPYFDGWISPEGKAACDAHYGRKA